MGHGAKISKLSYVSSVIYPLSFLTSDLLLHALCPMLYTPRFLKSVILNYKGA